MYSLIIPPSMVSSLYKIRELTGRSIRGQILDAIEEHIKTAKFKGGCKGYVKLDKNRAA